MSAADFIRRTGWDPLLHGQNDCANWCASLVEEVTGRDPAAGIRGTYATAFECRQLLMREGGLLALSRRLMSWLPAGGEGDGVAVARVRRTIVAGVLCEGRLWLKAEGGVVSPAEFDLLERWTL